MGDLDAIFKAYDVRGRVDSGQLDADAAEAIGAGFARFVGTSEVAVGRDCRPSSPALAEAFMRGVTGQGVDVVDLGEVATDVVYYHSGVAEMPGAVITASHNPSAYNGIKMCHRRAAPIGAESGLGEIKAYAENHVGDEAAADRGSIRRHDAEDGYVAHVLGAVDLSRIGPLRVAVDGGNGMAGKLLGRVFDALAAELLGLYLEPDGTFPNHPADPLDPANLEDLRRFMADHQVDLGVAFDGDADRAFFLDETGEPVSGSTTTAIIADWFLDREPGAHIVHNLICSRAVPELVERQGGVPVRTRVGHSYIKQVMAETDAVFGGEHSGHYYFRRNFRADSGMLAMLVLLQVLSEAGTPMSVLRASYEPYAASGEVNTVVDDPQAAMQRVEERFDQGTVDHLDGLTVDLGDRWFNLRPSNTEPLLRLNVEAPDSVGVDQLVGEVLAVIRPDEGEG